MYIQYLPKCVKLFPIGNGEFASFVLVDAIVHDLAVMEETECKGAIVISLPDTVEKNQDELKE